MIVVLGGLLTLAGAVLLYAGAPNQRLLGRAGRRPALLGLGGCVCLLALPLLLAGAGPATAIFIWLTLAMLPWSTVPIAAAWWHRSREGSE